jgi:hypothetical protein
MINMIKYIPSQLKELLLLKGRKKGKYIVVGNEGSRSMKE